MFVGMCEVVAIWAKQAWIMLKHRWQLWINRQTCLMCDIEKDGQHNVAFLIGVTHWVSAQKVYQSILVCLTRRASLPNWQSS